MKIKGIDINMKWNDYESDTLYLWNGKDLFVISEGSGDNLWEEDKEEGYVDYWMTQCYGKDCDYDGGQWMETELISDIDYTIQGVIDRISECDLWDDDWKVLDDYKGSELVEFYSDYLWAKGNLNRVINNINEEDM